LDDRRFDSLVKSLAVGSSRRSLLKGLLGLSGAVAAGGLAERTAEAARRGSTPTPTPVSCPGNQIASNGVCSCPNGLSKCGAECCNPSGIGAAHSECCNDNEPCTTDLCNGDGTCSNVYDCQNAGCCPEGWGCSTVFNSCSPCGSGLDLLGCI